MITKFRIVLAFLFLLTPITAACGEIMITAQAQQELRVSVYNKDLALVRDKRTLEIEEGVNTLAFREVSSRIIPETASLKSEGLIVLEQNFEYDLLSPQSLLQKYVGRDVILGTINPVTGKETEEKATVLSAGSGVVLKTEKHILTDVRGQLRFPDVPENLRDRPTLTMLISAKQSGTGMAELTYLSRGLSWKADYIAELNKSEDALGLSGWVTLSNNSGATYRNADLQLIAGDVHMVRERLQPERAIKYAAVAGAPVEEPMTEEAMFEYHMYTLGRKTTIAENQQKQVALMGTAEVACSKQYFLKGNPYYYRGGYGDLGQKLKVGVFVSLQNEKKDGLGKPLPAGVVRVYKKDGNGYSQFIGEDRIEHTPEGETVRLKLGQAFDITADKRQIDFAKISGGRDQEVFESEYELTVRNAKKTPVTVRVVEPVPGDWEVLNESIPHRKEAAHILSWDVEVPAEGEQQLVYRVRVRL